MSYLCFPLNKKNPNNLKETCKNMSYAYLRKKFARNDYTSVTSSYE